MGVVPEDPGVWVDRTQRSRGESAADPHFLLRASPDDAGWDRCNCVAAGKQKFCRNTQGCPEGGKAQNRWLRGHSVCPGGSQGNSDTAWSSAVRVTQSFCPSRPEESSSLALQSEPSLARRTLAQEPHGAGFTANLQERASGSPCQADERAGRLLLFKRASSHFWTPPAPSHSPSPAFHQSSRESSPSAELCSQPFLPLSSVSQEWDR